MENCEEKKALTLAELDNQIAEVEKSAAFQKHEAEHSLHIFQQHIAHMKLDALERQEYNRYEADMIRHYWVWRAQETRLAELKSLRRFMLCEK